VANVMLPGMNNVFGLWPAVWTMRVALPTQNTNSNGILPGAISAAQATARRLTVCGRTSTTHATSAPCRIKPSTGAHQQRCTAAMTTARRRLARCRSSLDSVSRAVHVPASRTPAPFTLTGPTSGGLRLKSIYWVGALSAVIFAQLMILVCLEAQVPLHPIPFAPHALTILT
jgi:hypothetical protein